jgi:hypothetical protein
MGCCGLRDVFIISWFWDYEWISDLLVLLHRVELSLLSISDSADGVEAENRATSIYDPEDE